MSPSWADGDEEGRLAEWAGVGRHKLARAQPKAAQYGASLPVRRCGEDMSGWRCECLAGACGSIDGCVREAERTAVGEEASLDLCRECYDEHRDAALAVFGARL